jgi:predicted transcriptional regulator
MKTAISIPDDVFAEADALARKTGTSRSELYSRAVREYVARYSTDAITEALDSVCDSDVGEMEFARAAARRALSRTEW